MFSLLRYCHSAGGLLTGFEPCDFGQGSFLLSPFVLLLGQGGFFFRQCGFLLSQCGFFLGPFALFLGQCGFFLGPFVYSILFCWRR